MEINDARCRDFVHSAIDRVPELQLFVVRKMVAATNGAVGNDAATVERIVDIRDWSFHQLSHIINVYESLHNRDDRNTLLQHTLLAFRQPYASQCILIAKPRHITPIALLKLLTCGLGANMQRVEAKVRDVLCSNLHILPQLDERSSSSTNENCCTNFIPMSLDARISLKNMHAWYDFVDAKSQECAKLPIMRAEFEKFFDRTGCNLTATSNSKRCNEETNIDVFDGRFCPLCVKMLQRMVARSTMSSELSRLVKAHVAKLTVVDDAAAVAATADIQSNEQQQQATSPKSMPLLDGVEECESAELSRRKCSLRDDARQRFISNDVGGGDLYTPTPIGGGDVAKKTHRNQGGKRQSDRGEKENKRGKEATKKMRLTDEDRGAATHQWQPKTIDDDSAPSQ